MTVKTKVEELATALNTAADSLDSSLQNLSADIQNLTGQLANASSEAEVTSILQPVVDKVNALAQAAAALKDVVPDANPAQPPEEL